MIIITIDYGRLGNKLLVYSHALAYGIDSGHAVINLTFNQYSDSFQGVYSNQRLVEQLAPKSRLTLKIYRNLIMRSLLLLEPTKYIQVLQFGFSTDFDDVASTKAKIIVVHQFAGRSLRSLKCHADKVRAFFTPIKSIREPVDALLAAITSGAKKIGVHLRIEDYRHWMHGKYFIDQSKYLKLCHDLYRRDSSSYFVICSTEPDISRAFSDLPHVIGIGSPVQDMYMLSQCDSIIGPPSTFSAWASFYGNVPFVEVLPQDSCVKLGKACVPYLSDRDQVPEDTRWVLHY